MTSEPTDMTTEEIARDLASVGCSCDDMGEADACPNFTDGWCRKASNAIAIALRAAEARGYERAREQALGIAWPQMTSLEYAAAIRAMQPETNP